MANVKAAAAGAIRNVGEVVVKPAVDEVGKAIEQGVQSVIGGPQAQPQLTQGQIEQNRADEQNKYTEAQRKIQWWKKLDEEQRKVREQQKSLDAARDKQETAKKQKVKQFEIVEKKKETAVQQAQARVAAEKRIGKGVGG